VSVSAVAEACAEPAAAAGLRLAPTAALLFFARSLQYVIVGATGVILARGLGPEGRGVFGLINETALMASSLPGLGLEAAGIFLVGQKRFSLQNVVSNGLCWTLGLALIFAGLVVTLLFTNESLLGMSARELSIALAGASLIMICDGVGEYLMPLNRTVAYTTLKTLIPVLRFAGIAVLALGIGLSVDKAAAVWIGSLAVAAVLTIVTLSRDIRFLPRLDISALRAQASYGARTQAGWIFQALNHRLDVFVVGYFVGTAGVGYYLVGVNLAELSWWVPMALGTVLFPKASAMGARDNFDMSAAACRRTLAINFAACLGLLVVVRPLITVVYGGEFQPSVDVFTILVPSGLIYTVHKVLGTSMAAHGRPQVTLFGGLASFPATVGLNLLLVPAWGITGAAVASVLAY